METIEAMTALASNITQPSMSELRSWQNKVQTSNRCFVAGEFEESSKVRTQMTASRAGALTDNAKQWSAIDWQET